MWATIGTGNHSGGPFTIDLTDAGRFPAGTFSRIRLTLDGDTIPGGVGLLLRVNGDDSPELHQSDLATRDFAAWTPTVTPGGGTAWRVAQWHTTLCAAEVIILRTAVPSRLPYRTWGARLSGASGSHRESVGSGRLTGDRLIDSVRVEAEGASFVELNWAAEGWMPHSGVINACEGVPTHESAPVVARVTGTHARLAVWDDEPLTGSPMLYDAPVSPAGVARFTATRLAPDTDHWWRVEVDHRVDESVTGRFRTLPAPGVPVSFTLAASACASGLNSDPVGAVLADRVSNHMVFDEIRQVEPLLFAHLGDFHYYDLGSGKHGLPSGIDGASLVNYRRGYDDVLMQPRQAGLYRQVPLLLGWDDHDYGPNNSDRTHVGRANAQQVYAERVPFLGALPGSGGQIFQAHQIGRVLIVLADTRSDRDPNSDPAGPGKTMLGTEQKTWLQNLLSTTSAEVLVWLMPSPWLGDGRPDSWDDFADERDEMIQMFSSLGWIDRMCIVGGDMHALAIDTGGNSPGGIPVFQFASLDSTDAAVTNAYDTGPSLPGGNQWGTVDIDDDGSTITVNGTARVGATSWLSHAVTVTT